MGYHVPGVSLTFSFLELSIFSTPNASCYIIDFILRPLSLTLRLHHPVPILQRLCSGFHAEVFYLQPEYHSPLFKVPLSAHKCLRQYSSFFISSYYFNTRQLVLVLSHHYSSATLIPTVSSNCFETPQAHLLPAFPQISLLRHTKPSGSHLLPLSYIGTKIPYPAYQR